MQVEKGKEGGRCRQRKRIEGREGERCTGRKVGDIGEEGDAGGERKGRREVQADKGRGTGKGGKKGDLSVSRGREREGLWWDALLRMYGREQE